VDGAVFGRAREESTIMNDPTLIPMRVSHTYHIFLVFISVKNTSRFIHLNR